MYMSSIYGNKKKTFLKNQQDIKLNLDEIRTRQKDFKKTNFQLPSATKQLSTILFFTAVISK